jgi:hypothetical protein
VALNYNITQAYPDDITSNANKNRSIKLLVKQTKSLAAVSELQKKLEDTGADIVSLGNEAVGNKPSNVDRQKGIKTRSMKMTNSDTIYGCALPLPNELNESQSHDWSTSKGYVGRVGELANPLSQIVGEVASSAGFRKPLIDPGYFQDYNGTEPREFTFSWDFIPNNADEAENIYNILYNLKKYTLPASTVNGVSLVAPFLFDIEIGHESISSLINMNNVVCKSMSINYSAEGALQFLPDGSPKFMKLEMSFAERATVTTEIY